MNSASERRVVYVLCLVVLVLGLITLNQSLLQEDIKPAGVSVALIALSIVTAIAASRSGRAGDEIEDVMVDVAAE